MLSPCMANSILPDVPIKLCSDNVDCTNDKFEYAISEYTTKKGLEVIGMAKDGRAIYGPYKADGTLWKPCDVDVCNGRVILGDYSYVSTSFYPYFVGCWGPSDSTKLSA